MSTYIKLSTKEFPRHIGDIRLDPAGMEDYALVQFPELPLLSDNQMAYPTPPVEIDGVWRVDWKIVTFIPKPEPSANTEPDINKQ